MAPEGGKGEGGPSRHQIQEKGVHSRVIRRDQSKSSEIPKNPHGYGRAALRSDASADPFPALFLRAANGTRTG